MTIIQARKLAKAIKKRKESEEKILHVMEAHEIGKCYDKQRVLNIFKDLGYDQKKAWKDFEKYMMGSTVGLAIDSEYSTKKGQANMVPLYYHCDLKRFLTNNCDPKTYNPD